MHMDKSPSLWCFSCCGVRRVHAHARRFSRSSMQVAPPKGDLLCLRSPDDSANRVFRIATATPQIIGATLSSFLRFSGVANSGG